MVSGTAPGGGKEKGKGKEDKLRSHGGWGWGKWTIGINGSRFDLSQDTANFKVGENMVFLGRERVLS